VLFDIPSCYGVYLVHIERLVIQSMIWASTLQIWRHGYHGDINFIILFVGILPLYAINLDVV